MQTRDMLDYSTLAKSQAKSMQLTAQSFTSLQIDKARLQTAIERKQIEVIRQYSRHFYEISGQYRELVNYRANLLLNLYITIPTGKLSAYNAEVEFLSNQNLQYSQRQIARKVIRDGAWYGLEKDNGFFTLPFDYCRSRFSIGAVAVVEFNVRYFDQFREEKEQKAILATYPKEVSRHYQSYLTDSTIGEWVLLDPTIARCHHTEDTLPMLIGVLPSILELQAANELEKLKKQKELYKIIIQKIPTNKDGEVTLFMEEIEALDSNLQSMLDTNLVDTLTTPCDIDTVEFEDSRASTNSDGLDTVKNLLYDSSGTSSMLFNGSKNSMGLKESILADTATMYELLLQSQAWYNNKLSHSKLKFLPITLHNLKDMQQLYTNADAKGYAARSLVMATLGLTTEEHDLLLQYENETLSLPDKMIPTSSSYQQTGGEKTVGAPTKEDLTPEGEKSKEGEKNKTRKN